MLWKCQMFSASRLLRIRQIWHCCYGMGDVIYIRKVNSVLPEFKIENRHFFSKNAKINKKCSFHHFFSIFVQFCPILQFLSNFCPILSDFSIFVQFLSNFIQFCPILSDFLSMSAFVKLFNLVQFSILSNFIHHFCNFVWFFNF